MDSEQVLRNATATWTADHVEEALEHPDPDVRQSMLVYALRDLSESDLHAIVRAAGEHIENRRSARRTAPAAVSTTRGKARLFRRRDAGNVYNLYPYLPTGPGTGTPWVLVSHRDGQTTVSMCDHEGDVPSKPGVQDRFVTVVTDEEALSSLGYEVVLPTDQSPEPAAQPGIPGVEAFVAERDRRETAAYGVVCRDPGFKVGGKRETGETRTATLIREYPTAYGHVADYRMDPPVGKSIRVCRVRTDTTTQGTTLTTLAAVGSDREVVESWLSVLRLHAPEHEHALRTIGYTLVAAEEEDEK